MGSRAQRALVVGGKGELARRPAGKREQDAEQHARALARWQLAGAARSLVGGAAG